MPDFHQELSNLSGLSSEAIQKLFSTFIVVLVFLLLRLLAVRVVNRSVQEVGQQYRWRRVITYVATVLILLVVGRIWFVGFQSIATFAGLLGAGLAVAMHDTVANFTGWIFILWRRPFGVGDRIEIANTKGDVIDVRLFQFSLLELGNWVGAEQSTGRIVHIPNGMVLRERLANYTSGFEYVWNEIPVLVTFESDWRRAKEILIEVSTAVAPVPKDAERQIRQASERYMIFYGKLTPIVYTSVQDSGVLLTLRYMTKPRARRAYEEKMWERILDAFAEHPNIDFAYPTIRRFDNRVESKPAVSNSFSPKTTVVTRPE